MRPDRVLLSAYLDGEVPEPFRTDIESFIQSDPVCRDQYEELRQLRTVLHRRDIPNLERLMEESLAAIHRRVAVNPGSRSFRRRQIQIPVAALAAAALVVVALGALLFWSFLPTKPATVPDYLAQGKNVDVTIRVDDTDIEQVLQWLADKEMLGEINIQLPEQQWQIVGDPVLLKPAPILPLHPVSPDTRNEPPIDPGSAETEERSE